MTPRNTKALTRSNNVSPVLFSCLNCAPAHYFASSSILKQDWCSQCLLGQSAARWIQGPLRMFSEIQGGFSLALSNTQFYSHTWSQIVTLYFRDWKVSAWHPKPLNSYGQNITRFCTKNKFINGEYYPRCFTVWLSFTHSMWMSDSSELSCKVWA